MRRGFALLLALGCDAEVGIAAVAGEVAIDDAIEAGEVAAKQVAPAVASGERSAVEAGEVAAKQVAPAVASGEVAAKQVAPAVEAGEGAVKVDPEVVPGEPEAIRAWVQALAYRSWQAQSPVHATGEHGGARVFFNETLVASMAVGAGEHPIGAAGVRELYESDLVTLRGFALMVKTGPSGQAGEGWYWFEMFGTTAETRPLVAEHGSRGCVGCHAAGVDFVHAPERP